MSSKGSGRRHQQRGLKKIEKFVVEVTQVASFSFGRNFGVINKLRSSVPYMMYYEKTNRVLFFQYLFYSFCSLLASFSAPNGSVIYFHACLSNSLSSLTSLCIYINYFDFHYVFHYPCFIFYCTFFGFHFYLIFHPYFWSVKQRFNLSHLTPFIFPFGRPVRSHTRDSIYTVAGSIISHSTTYILFPISQPPLYFQHMFSIEN